MNLKKPRGIRNNNPLNIRIGCKWIGEVDNPTDTQFEQFKMMKYGVRAAFLLIRRYINHYKLKTIPQIISRWAPNNENDTDTYAKCVCKLSGISETEELDWENQAQMINLFDAMCFVENGQHIDDLDIIQGIGLARMGSGII